MQRLGDGADGHEGRRVDDQLRQRECGPLRATSTSSATGAKTSWCLVGGALPNASTYRASSSAPGVATVSILGSNLTLTPVAAGVATVTVTATGADDSVATRYALLKHPARLKPPQAEPSAPAREAARRRLQRRASLTPRPPP